MLAGAPGLLALLTAAAGVMLLTSGATPSDPGRFMWLAQHTPIILIEISHFLSSILGLVLILLAFGLSRRLDGAWGATAVTLMLAAILALFKGFDWEESVALVVLLLMMAPCREAPSTADRGCRDSRSRPDGCSRRSPRWRARALSAGGRSNTWTTPTFRC